MKRLTDILNKVAAKTNPTVRQLDDDPPTTDPRTEEHSCCLPTGLCQEMFDNTDLGVPHPSKLCEDLNGVYQNVHCYDRECFDETIDMGVCVNCETETCSLIQDCMDEEQTRACIDSGGSVKCEIDDFWDDDGNYLYPTCQEFLEECYGSPDSKPGACCLIAMQPAPPFYIGCVNVQNAQQCTDMGLQSGGLVKTTFQEGKECGLRGPGSPRDQDLAECPLMWDEYGAPWGACCRRCYERDENGHLILKLTDCFHSKESRCLLRNWEDDQGNPGHLHPDHKPGDPFCLYSYGGDDIQCGQLGDKFQCDGPHNPELEDDWDHGHPFPWRD